MTTGWPQNQQDLRWPYAENDDTGPAGPVRGRLATDADSGDAESAGFGRAGSGPSGAGTEHPSGPLPVGRMRDPQQKGRLGRKSRGRSDSGPDDAVAGDADYDWIKYLGEAGPAQESGRRGADVAARAGDVVARPAEHAGRLADPSERTANPSGRQADDEPGEGRRAGRRMSRRHAAQTNPAPAAPPLPSSPAPSPARSAPADHWPAEVNAPSIGRADSRSARSFNGADTDPASPLAPTYNAPTARSRGGREDAPARSDRPSQDLFRRARQSQDRPIPDRAPADPSPSGGWDQPRQTGSWETGSAWPEAVRPQPARPAWPDGSQPDPAPSRWPGSERLGSERPGSERPGFERPGSERRGPNPLDRTDVRPSPVYPTSSAAIAPPAQERRLHRWTPAEARTANAADSPATFAWPMDADQRRSGRASASAPAVGAALAPAERDLELEPATAPTERTGHGKAARPAKADRASKADRTGQADRAGKAGRKARRNARRPGRPGAVQAATVSPAPWDAAVTGAMPRSAAPWSEAPARGQSRSSVSAGAAPTGALTAGAAPTVRPARADSASAATMPRKSAAPRTSTRSRRGPARGLRRRPVVLSIAAGVVLIVALVAFLARGLLGGTGPAHTISTPSKLGAFALEPQLALGMGAEALRATIVKKGNGEATHVVDAVYEISSGPAAKSGPLIVLFIGGNLSGSASSFISSFTGLLPGAFVTSPGALGGQAACVPGYSGHPAECAWADNDTFGLFASPTLSAAALGNELRSLRPHVEHVRK
jgi:hypothetical protein